MTKDEREKLIQALANLDEIVHAIGYKAMRAAGAATSWHKVYEILNDLIRPRKENT